MKTYTETLTENSNVSPFAALANIAIDDDIANYGNVVSVVALGGGNTAKPMTIKLSSGQTRCFVYGMGINESVTVRITFMRT